MAHTPGPWFAKFDENGGYDCITSAWVVKSGGQFTVATIDLSHYGQTGREDATDAGKALAASDACLIAAAPDLLAACKAVCDAPNEDADLAAMALVIAAIAKAEGR